MDTIRNWHINPEALNIKNIVSIREKSYWSNPPFTKNVSTKIGKSFLSLSDLNFPRNYIYNSIFNKKQNQSKLQLRAKYKIYYKQPQYESFKQYHWDWGKLRLQKREQMPSIWKRPNPKHRIISTDHVKQAQL